MNILIMLKNIQLKDVFVPDDHFMGEPGRGLQQVLSIFTHSRVPISAMTLGTAAGAFDLAIAHGIKRKIFGQRIVDLQSKSFEIAEFYAHTEAARLMLFKACETLAGSAGQYAKVIQHNQQHLLTVVKHSFSRIS